ncbi:LacI family DNA-binding transcriptional regulator [Candidatus Symbiopectobacterium sp. 'North America']|uniref:LacI family DNA-binding transcriptional regulator n=1 Tax=Candidatus Symbiopectobacterium sp. 'North America' TaxID=2794574 RepID=UPI001FD1FDDD|nr:helix-turn-helix domain-containing protein [Candidatus Symbiopectobacterium sp. 'North America']
MKNNHEKDSGGTEKLDGGACRVRLEDIAARCGTSLNTVSRALSGEKGVSQALRAQILEVARAVRYSPAVEMGAPVSCWPSLRWRCWITTVINSVGMCCKG